MILTRAAVVSPVVDLQLVLVIELRPAVFTLDGFFFHVRSSYMTVMCGMGRKSLTAKFTLRGK